MSFNRLDYDKCSYKQEISESIGPGEYQLNTPFISCDDCYNRDPQIILQRSGNSVAKQMPMIDVDSELSPPPPPPQEVKIKIIKRR